MKKRISSHPNNQSNIMFLRGVEGISLCQPPGSNRILA
jgi:hypothetical protein